MNGMARGTASWKAANHKRLPQNRGKNHKPLSVCRADDEVEHPATSSSVPLALQQQCVNIFRDACPSGEHDASLLQEVKGHLYQRDFARAFGKPEYLRVYAARWSPSRALGYLQIFHDLQHALLAGRHEPAAAPLRMLCLGGGAGAELVALAAWLHEQQIPAAPVERTAVHAVFLDIAAWGDTFQSLSHAVHTPAILSKYASAAARAANTPLLAQQDALDAHFQQADVLALADEAGRARYAAADVITLMFTLNELYSTSVPSTQNMLTRITDAARPGALLLVVDSPGSYSTVALHGADGKEETTTTKKKKYPMQWLLDHTLLGSQQKRGEAATAAQWEKVVSDESRWFRLPEKVEYRLELENMRYQIHLYRRLADEAVFKKKAV